MKSLLKIWGLPDSTPVWVDVDTGIDDAIALLVLSRWAKALQGISVVGGNINVDQATYNTLGINSLFVSPVPVYKGARCSLKGRGFIYAPEFHGPNGLGTLDLGEVNPKNQAKSGAIAGLNRYLHQPGPKIVICLGPSTNIARVLNREPALAADLHVVMMGGALDVPGNHHGIAEFNFFQDPEAVESIWRLVKMVAVVSLDVTKDVRLPANHLKGLPNTAAGRAVRYMLEWWYENFGKPYSREFELYDPLTVVGLFQDTVQFELLKLAVSLRANERGKVVLDPTNGHDILWARQTNSTACLKVIEDGLDD